MQPEIQHDAAGPDQLSLFSTEQVPAKTANFPQSKGLSAAIGHFVLDQGVPGTMKFLTNGLNYKELYGKFCESHSNIKISFEEFESYVIESIKRTLAGSGAELASLIGTSGAVFAKQLGNFPNESMFLFSFCGITMANFLTFATAWYTSHHGQFRNPDGSFDARKFVKTLVAEYGKHFGPIALSADALESFLIHQLVNNTNLNEYAVAVPITLFCSIAAIGVYFYEQQTRTKIEKMFTQNNIGRAVLDGVCNIRNLVYSVIGSLSFDIAKFF